MKRFVLVLSLLLSFGVFSWAVPSGPTGGLVLLNNLALWQDQLGGKLEWMESLTIGDKVTLVGRTQNFTVEGKERDYIRVKVPSGKEGWVRTPYIGVNATLGVIKVESALVYSEPRDLKVTANALNFLTIVAILDNGSTREFAKVAAVNPVDEIPYNLNTTYLTYPDITINADDVAAAVLYYVGKSAKNAGVKKNLLALANKKYATSIFLPKIQAVLGDGVVVSPPDVSPFVGSYPVNENKVNVRSSPTTDALVVSQLSLDTSVTVKERTAQTSLAGGKTDYWYHIIEPIDGWVFGTFITINP